jgi:hypothetical protein
MSFRWLKALPRTRYGRRSAAHARCLTMSSVSGSKGQSSTPVGGPENTADMSTFEEHPLEERTLPTYFQDHLLPSFGDRPALVCKAEPPHHFGGPSQSNTHLRWTFGNLDDHVVALAKGLISLGVKKGDRIGVIMGNNRYIIRLLRGTTRLNTIQCICLASMGQRAHWCCFGHDQPSLPRARAGASWHKKRCALLSSCVQQATLNLVGVSTLVVVPQIRTSRYLSMLASIAPSLTSVRAGHDLLVPELPSLRRILSVELSDELAPETHAMRSVIDFRNVLLWNSGQGEHEQMQSLEGSLDRHEVINLQFTR